jgi:hypothetical protein
MFHKKYTTLIKKMNKNSSKYSQVRSCCKDFVVINPIVQLELNFDVLFKIYYFLSFKHFACLMTSIILFAFECIYIFISLVQIICSIHTYIIFREFVKYVIENIQPMIKNLNRNVHQNIVK